MVTVEKTTGGRVFVRGIGEFEGGEQADVDKADAAYLCDERGDFERVDETSVADQIDAGDCPWCDEYEGDAVGQHASAAHPDEWDAYTEG